MPTEQKTAARAAEDNRQARRDGAVDRARQLAAQVWKAHRAAGAASIAQRLEPGPDTRQALLAAVRQRAVAAEELREACLHDDALVARVLFENRP